MINVPLTRNQVLELMKDLTEEHWMQILLMEALMKNDFKIQHTKDSSEEITVAKPVTQDNRLTAEDVPVHQAYQPEFCDKEYAQDEKVLCDFVRSWSGLCKKPSIVGANQCLEHFNVKCSNCDSIATNDCGETFQFVCGAALCETHKNRHGCVTRNRHF